MKYLRHWFIILIVALAFPPARQLAAQTPAVATSATDVDLAAVVLPVDQYPEPGYQRMGGDFTGDADLVPNAATAYVAGAELLVDRADPDGDWYTKVITRVEVDPDGAASDDDLMFAFERNADGEERVDDGGIDHSTTATLHSSGDIGYQTILARGPLLIRIQTLGGRQEIALDDHLDIVRRSADHAASVLSAGQHGVSPYALRFLDGDAQGATVSSVSSMYRVIDGTAQPVVGETDPLAVPDGITSVYQTLTQVRFPEGETRLHSSLLTFGSDAAASQFGRAFVASPALPLVFSPFDHSLTDIAYAPDEAAGVIRFHAMAMSGGQEKPASGTIALRRTGSVVHVLIAVGQDRHSTPQSAFPALMSAQAGCLEAGSPCQPLPADLLVHIIGASNDQSTPEALDRANGYTSEQFGWSIDPAGTGWVIEERESGGQYESISLRNGDSRATIESIVDHHGDPEQCILDELDDLRNEEEHADIRLWDDDRVTGAGLEDGHGWITYTVEPLTSARADQEYAIRIDCYTLRPGVASLVIHHTAPRDTWPTERQKGDDLRERLTIHVGTDSRRSARLS